METALKQNYSSTNLGKTFFSQNAALGVQYNPDKNSIYLQIGKKDQENWIWIRAKMKDTELGDILRVLRGKVENVSFYHKYNGKETKIWVNRKDDTVFFKIEEFSEALNSGEQEVLILLLEEMILLNLQSGLTLKNNVFDK